MKTVFKKGMKVYDRLVFPNKEAEVIDIIEDSQFPIRVWYEGLKADELIYTTDGRYYQELEPSLSTKPYTIEGFEQKAPTPTYEEALKEAHRKDEYYYLPNDLEAPSEELANAAVALLKLLFLRDYYNEGWQPDFSKETKNTKYCISKDASGRFMKYDYYNYDFNNVLIFKSKQIRSKFWDEQLELMKIAKPLL